MPTAPKPLLNQSNSPEHIYQFSIRLCQWQRGLKTPEGHVLTGEAIAQAIGIPAPLWYRYRGGHHYPKMHNLQALAQIYGIDLHWLITGQTAPAIGMSLPKGLAKSESPNGTTHGTAHGTAS